MPTGCTTTAWDPSEGRHCHRSWPYGVRGEDDDLGLVDDGCGQPLGPAVIGAVALSRAADGFTHALATSPLPAGAKAAGSQVAAEGGPLAVNTLPPQSPPGAAGPLALQALGGPDRDCVSTTAG
ncbi:hypothetical protein GCM10009612_69950 [Streptomyces beijiangensis]